MPSDGVKLEVKKFPLAVPGIHIGRTSKLTFQGLNGLWIKNIYKKQCVMYSIACTYVFYVQYCKYSIVCTVFYVEYCTCTLLHVQYCTVCTVLYVQWV